MPLMTDMNGTVLKSNSIFINVLAMSGWNLLSFAELCEMHRAVWEMASSLSKLYFQQSHLDISVTNVCTASPSIKACILDTMLAILLAIEQARMLHFSFSPLGKNKAF